MNTNAEFCDMKNKPQTNVNTISGIFVLLLGGLITLSLLLLKYAHVFNLDLEVVLAPFVVITLLTYGDKLLIFLFLNPASFVLKLISKVRNSPKSQQQLTPKQS